MRWIQPENPGHVHIRTLRMRLVIPLLVASAAVVAIAVSTVFALAEAARRDAGASMLSLAKASASVANPSLPDGARHFILDRRGIGRAGELAPSRQLVTEVLSRKEGTAAFTDDDGVNRMYGFTRSGAEYAAVGLPTDMVFAELKSALFSWALLGSGLAFVALWLAIALGEMLLVRRASRMASAFRKLASGELEAKEDLVRGMGELDEVTDVFETIAAKLQKAYSSTDENVKKRTVELEFNKGMAELEKARTEALLAAIGDGLIVTDGEGKINFVNQEGAHMLGYLPEELITQSAGSLLRLEDDKGVLLEDTKRPISVATTSREKYLSPVYPKPYYFVRKDKTRFPAQITVTPVIADGSVAGAIQVFRDITAEVEFDRRKSEFISIASHQLRSPLSAAKWLVDMLRKGDVGKLEPKQQDLADKLFQANERMVVLVNELLNVSRLESGTVKLSPVDTDLAALADAVMTESTPLLLEKKQSFAKEVAAVPHLTLDQSLIRELTANLISNASKYSPAGSVITVAVRQDGDDVVVSVKDQGMGIPQSDQSQLFRKFFRAENAAKSVTVGTGLGLYVCKAIAELHGGRIWFESVQDKGTTFYYSLPLKGAPIKAGEVNLT